ncbi:MAG: dockerin type I repeat-containing protein, partial [Oscillospiraceae bacterium]|nr:dockerin type I repeat-containing protein [Oscillospiraceae bacterium]
KAEEYYKDNLQELVVTEVQEDTIILAEKNPENSENPVVYEMSRMHLYLRDCFAGMLGDFNMEEVEVGDYGVFAVDPATQKAICAVEIHYGNAIDTSRTADFELINVSNNSIFVMSLETEEYYHLALDNKIKSVMSEEMFWSLSGGDVLLFTVDSDGNPEIPLKVDYEATVEDFIWWGMLYTVIGVNEDGTRFFLDNDCSLSIGEIEHYAETPFTPKYGDLICVDCNMFLASFPGQFALNPGVRIYPVGKAKDYYKDNLKELVVTEVQDYKIILAEENPEDPENPVVYQLNKVHPRVEGYYSANLNGFDVDTLAVGDSGVFAVDPATQKAICAVEIYCDDAIDTSQTAEFELIETTGDFICLESVETGECYYLELNKKTISVMSRETLRSLPSGDILLSTVDAEGNPVTPLEVTYEATVEDFIQRGRMYTVIGVNEAGTSFFLDNGCDLSLWEIERHAETPFTPAYGDLICVDWDCIVETFPGEFGLNPGVRIYPVGKAGDYYKDDLKELVVTEVEEYEIFLTEKNPENPEEPVVYQLNKVHPWVEDYYSADLNGFDVDTLAVGDSGVFAVDPDNQVICAVEIHAGEEPENSGEISAVPEQPTIAKGDVNGDGEIGISDMILINRVYVGIDEISKEKQEAGDIDKNGKIDLADSMLVLRYIVGLEDSLELDF